MVRVKICGITNLEDALAAVEAGADELGFNLYPESPRHVSAEAARVIAAALPHGVLKVGVFVNAGPPAEVARLADIAGFDAVQLHGDETPEYCSRLQGRPVIKALRVREGFGAAEAARYGTAAVLLDAYVAGLPGGTGRTFDWAVARRVREAVPRLYLAGGLGPGNVAAAVGAVGPYAVDVCGGVESSPGRKNGELLRHFVRAAKSAEEIA